jgi:hypothetical protein
MEYVAGGDLSTLIAEKGVFSENEARRIVRQICEALAAAATVLRVQVLLCKNEYDSVDGGGGTTPLSAKCAEDLHKAGCEVKLCDSARLEKKRFRTKVRDWMTQYVDYDYGATSDEPKLSGGMHVKAMCFGGVSAGGRSAPTGHELWVGSHNMTHDARANVECMVQMKDITTGESSMAIQGFLQFFNQVWNEGEAYVKTPSATKVGRSRVVPSPGRSRGAHDLRS